MPKMSDPSTAPPIRMMLMGNSGTGKTGGLASLALAGYRLWIADFDNGYEIIRNILAKSDPAALDRVDFEVCRDPYKVMGSTTIPADTKAWAKGLKYLESVLKQPLTPEDVIVIDSLSFAAKAAVVYYMKINGRPGAAPQWQEWGEIHRLVESLIAMMVDDSIRAHLICTAHIAQTGGKRVEKVGKGPDAQSIVIDEGPIRKLPATVGKALNPVIPRYFNHMILVNRVGSGAAAKYSLHTRPHDDIELKNTSPGSIKPEYPLATGLADYFADARGTSPKGTKP